MRRKINVYLIGISIAAVIATMLCVTFVFYGLFEKQVRADLRIDAEILKGSGVFTSDRIFSDIEEEISARSSDPDDLRVTWIDSDGTVLYDNGTAASYLENHSDRPEFESALESGEGESRRRSDTMGKDTFYYAILLEDGSVLRVSEDVNSLYSVFLTVAPAIVLIVLVIILICALISHVLTGQILSPIEKMAQNLGEASDTPVYEELIPFLDTIREQHENVLSAAKSRQDFTANVSHELKTPLTAISGYAELIENHMVDDDEEERCARQIHENADRLLSLINDIIRLSELDSASEDDLASEEFDLYEAAGERVELLQVSAGRKHVSLTLEGEPCPMRGNRNMIIELIDNLTQNAIQYNREDGKACVSVWKESGRPLLTVSDNGIGIPKDMQDRVFERFFRVDKSRSRETGGTGLGLAIVKHIVELHDAQLTIESEPGKGTAISVRF